MIEYDTLQRFLFKHAHVRGEIVRLRNTYHAISERHPYPMPIRKLLGETLAATALLSATIKFQGSLILQIESKGPVQLLVAQSDHEYHLRGLAQWQEEVSDEVLAQQTLSRGRLALTITPKEGERYQGIVELRGENLATALEKYFHDSEQLPTLLYLCADETTVAGMLLQSMPQENAAEQKDFWEHVVHLTRTLTDQELLNLNNQTILHRLFHEEDLQLFDAEPVAFRCTCTIERMERALLLMSYAELQELLQTHKKVIVTCEFCNNQYSFDAVDVAKLFADSQHVISDSSTRH